MYKMFFSKDTPIVHVLELDSEHVKKNCLKLTKMGLLELIQDIPKLFASLMHEFEGRKPSLEASLSDKGLIELPWEFILKVLMLQSANTQYLQATTHLLRGHSIEIFGHMRTMIENAGVAYLSFTDPSIATSYIQEKNEYREQTISSKILPKTDPLTSQLNEDFKMASKIFHTNFISLAGKIRSSVRHTDTKGIFENIMEYYDDDAQQGRFYLLNTFWFLSVSPRVLRVLAASCEVPKDALWYTQIEEFEREAAARHQELAPKIFPNAETRI